MTLALYGRSWAITIGQPGSATQARYTDNFGTGFALRLQFAVERTLASTSNKAKISVTNLTPDNRANIRQGTLVTLEAGYGNQRATIFQGYVAKVENSRDGGDYTTQMECGDGEPIITYGSVNLSYATPTTLAQVLQDIADSIGVTLGGQSFALQGQMLQGIPNYVYPRLVLHGAVRTALDSLLRPRNVFWSIQCGVLLVQNKRGTLNLVAEVLSGATGMIGIPTRTATGVKVTSLLNPRLTPGSAIQVQSVIPGASGNFRAVKCTYSGDSEGDDWSVEIEGQPLAGPLDPVPAIQNPKKAQQAVITDTDTEGDAE